MNQTIKGLYDNFTSEQQTYIDKMLFVADTFQQSETAQQKFLELYKKDCNVKQICETVLNDLGL